MLTTSGHFHTRTLYDTIGEIGTDRVLFSVDYPYESAVREFMSGLSSLDGVMLGHHGRSSVRDSLGWRDG
ncbi:MULTISPECIES: hypothetical protein [unclassified Streptomyces]|uniref:hypothetical protein n=1 Tax=unclassified Streptomyces TaxID=2593676 RepID=UPI00224F9045|nr:MULTISPECIES: hypothetical protein [unclassified Streptomyces]WSP53211.1 hypothetical protein OG306_01315 [Streptomyces sp. NBC_01241]MCX4792122.1 hypothetical protein [Streptomyces sp. NBC_01221]MCX4799975.1 hypothetical protein [Streptomyces sp. NBC_01242]WSJ40632.1 hypothetical protein OG772_34920 [Streptomyces sp. NBC_01321]WSP66953.1 hypothetical protein OG466_37665 [Streptomyces sp. NBC_01240]